MVYTKIVGFSSFFHIHHLALVVYMEMSRVFCFFHTHHLVPVSYKSRHRSQPGDRQSRARGWRPAGLGSALVCPLQHFRCWMHQISPLPLQANQTTNVWSGNTTRSATAPRAERSKWHTAFRSQGPEFTVLAIHPCLVCAAGGYEILETTGFLRYCSFLLSLVCFEDGLL